MLWSQPPQIHFGTQDVINNNTGRYVAYLEAGGFKCSFFPNDFYRMKIFSFSVSEACSQSYGGLFALAFIKEKIWLNSIDSLCRSLLIKRVLPKRDGTTHKVNTPSGVCFVGLRGVLLSIYKRVAHSWGERITFLSYIMMD